MSASEGKVMITVWDVSAKAKPLICRHQHLFPNSPFLLTLQTQRLRGTQVLQGWGLQKDQRQIDIRTENGWVCASEELGTTWIIVLTNPHFQLLCLPSQWQSGSLKAQLRGEDTQTVWSMQRDF